MATVDISGLPPPPGPASDDTDAAQAPDISNLPPPPGAQASAGPSIADLPPPPPPPATDPAVAALSPPPAQATRDDSAATGLPDSRIDEIAARNGVDPETLRDLAPYYGAATESRGALDSATQGGRAVIGTLGRTVGLGIPQFAAKKLASPEMERALDEVAEAGRSQHPVNQFTEGVVAAPTLGLGEVAGKAGVAARMAEGAGIGGVLGATGSKQGEEGQGAAIGAGLGLGLSGAAEALGAVTRRMARTSAERALQEAVPRGAEVDLQRATQQVAERTQQSEQALRDYVSTGKLPEGEEAVAVAREQLGAPTAEAGEATPGLGHDPELVSQGQQVAEERLRSFAEQVTGERPRDAGQAREALAEASRNQGGPDYLAGEYERFVAEQQAQTAIHEQSLRADTQQGFFGRAGNSLSNTFTLHRFDERLGTDLSTPYRQLNQNYNRSTFAADTFRRAEEPIAAEARRLGVDKDLRDGGRVAAALDSGNFSRLSPEEATVAKQVADHLEQVRQFANKLTAEDRSLGVTPMSIQPMRNAEGGVAYLPHVLVQGDELGTRVANKVEDALAQVSQQLGHEVGSLREIRPEEYRAVADLPAVQDLEQAVTYRDNRPVRDGRNLEQRLRELTNPLPRSTETVRGAPATRAAEAREEGMPDWLLERNVYKLMSMYTANTLRGVYLRAPMEQLASQARLLRQMGAEVEAGFVGRMLHSAQGNAPGSIAESMKGLRIGYARSLDKVTAALGGRETPAGAAVQMAKDVPVIMRDLARQIFPNAFGGSPRASLQHATAAIGKLMPELGSYGAVAGPRAATRVTQDWSKYSKMAEAAGGYPAQMTLQEGRHLTDGIRSTAPYAIAMQKIESVNKVGMAMFQFGEHTNRALAQSMAEVMAEDLARGSSQAARALQGMPRSVQRAAAAAPTTEAMQSVLASHLNTTIYNYSRMAKGEVARFLGPTLSTFSKWPTETAAELLYRYRSKGLAPGSVENAKRFLGPLLLLGAVDAGLGRDPVALESTGKDEAPDLVKKVTGSGGLTHMAPVNAVKPVVGAVARMAGVPMAENAEAYTPPLLSSAMGLTVEPLVKAFRQGEFDPEEYKESLRRSAHALASTYAPGAWVARTLLDDIPTYISGQRPGEQGDTQLEREAAGARYLYNKATGRTGGGGG